MTKPDEPEEYILTPEEESAAIAHETKRERDLLKWRLKDSKRKPEDVEAKLAAVDWENIFSQSQKREILQRYNANKIYEKWQADQRKTEKEQALEKQKKLIADWTATKMYRHMAWSSEKKFQKKFLLNENNRNLVAAVCFFLTQDPRFESELNFDLNKGLMIRGNAGVGKTHVVQCVQDNPLNPILILSMIEIADEVRLEGEFKIELGENKIVYLDDVGTEEATVNHYGTKINFFKDFIEQVYLRNQHKTFNKLIISTNCSFAEIEEKYGFRVRSRMKDMFNVIDVAGEDLRGLK